MVGGLIERGQPPHRHIRLVKQLVGQLKHSLYSIGLEQQAEHAEGKAADDARRAATGQIEHQHDKHHHHGVAQHEAEDGAHAPVRKAHLQGLDEGRQGDLLSRAGVAQDGRRLAPHIADVGLADADGHGGGQYEQQKQHRRQHGIDELAGNPFCPVDPHEEKGYPGGQKRHIRKQQDQ